MKTRNQLLRHLFVVAALFAILQFSVAQDDDHTVTDVSGRTYLDVNGNLPVPPLSFTVGTTPSNVGALIVRGEQMSTPTGITLNTYANYNLEHAWRMNKILQNGMAEYIGRIFNESGNSNKHFNIDARSAHLRFWTNQVPRASIYYRSSNATVNGYSFNPTGYMTLSLNSDFFTNVNVPVPFSLLHLVDATGGTNPNSYTPPTGYRGWMRNGVTFTGNSDQMYVGHKYGTSGVSRAVLQFSEANLNENRQYMSMVFTSDPSGSGAAAGADGLEIMRLWPEDNNTGYVGLGDFNTAAVNPTERLDLLNKTIRLRDFATSSTTSYQNNALTRVLVADGADGRVYWRDANTLGGAAGCQWTMNGSAPNHVYTAFGAANGSCPDAAEAVGIGVDLSAGSAPGKLGVLSTSYTRALDISNQMVTGSTVYGAHVDMQPSGSAYSYGMYINAAGSSTRNRGIHALTSGATGGGTAYAGIFESTDNSYSNNGLWASAVGSGTWEIGGDFYATSSNTSANIQAVSCAAPTTGYTNSWALFVNGDADVAGTIFTLSDENLKTNIEDLTGCTELILQLNPKRYMFRDEEYVGLNLSEGEHFGVIAQQVQEVVPQLVRDIHTDAKVDRDGNEIAPAMDYKAVDYNGLIPVLLGAIREQHAVIAQLQEQVAGMQQQMEQTAQLESRMAGMQAQVQSCCGMGSGGTRMVEVGEDVVGHARNLMVQPNPFNESATLSYTLEKAGRMQLMANSADGKQLKALTEATMEAGSYQYQWNTADMSPGVYYLTLLLDGEPMVKRAVKVMR